MLKVYDFNANNFRFKLLQQKRANISKLTQKEKPYGWPDQTYPFFLGEGGCLINTNFISHFLYSIIYYFNHNILCFIYLLFLNKIETNQTQFDT